MMHHNASKFLKEYGKKADKVGESEACQAKLHIFIHPLKCLYKTLYFKIFWEIFHKVA
jgi:hypothetical protein